MTGKPSKWANVKEEEKRQFTRAMADYVNGGAGMYEATWRALIDVYFLEEIRAKIHAVALLAEAGHDVSMIKIRSEEQLKGSAKETVR